MCRLSNLGISLELWFIYEWCYLNYDGCELNISEYMYTEMGTQVYCGCLGYVPNELKSEVGGRDITDNVKRIFYWYIIYFHLCCTNPCQ